jgi:hypothetical protein
MRESNTKIQQKKALENTAKPKNRKIQIKENMLKYSKKKMLKYSQTKKA